MTNSIELLKNGVLRWDYSLSGGFFLVWLGSKPQPPAYIEITTATGRRAIPSGNKINRGELRVGLMAFLPVVNLLPLCDIDFFEGYITTAWPYEYDPNYPKFVSVTKWFHGNDLARVVDAAVEYGKKEFSKLESIAGYNVEATRIDVFNNSEYIGTIYDTETIGALIDEYSIAEHPGEGELRFHDFDTAFDKFMLEYGETIEDTKADRGVKNETYMRA